MKKKKTMIKGRVPHNHIMRFCGAKREKFLDLQVSTWMCFHYVKWKQQISMRQDNRTELMWITNVHKKYHHKVYGYTYIQYIEICTGTIHTFFFFLEISDGGWSRGKIHINFECCVQLVSIILVSVLLMFWKKTK